MLVQSSKVDASDFGRISADILFCEVDLSAHIVFLEAKQNGVVHANVECIGCYAALKFLVNFFF